MSLVKSYHLRCDSIDLSTRRGESADQRYERFRSCRVSSKIQLSRTEESSKGARGAAKTAGWIRHSESFVIIPGHASAGTTEIAFDLCPNCKKDMVKTNA